MTMHSVQKLTTETVEIRSAQIEVKALVIGKKQVTMSVFRQIPREYLFEEAGASLLGIPWGRVNYFWGDMDTRRIHVLWKKGTELRRDLVRYWNAKQTIFSGYREEYRIDAFARIHAGFAEWLVCYSHYGHDGVGISRYFDLNDQSMAAPAYHDYAQQVAKHNQLIDAIMQTDQLFIAV